MLVYPGCLVDWMGFARTIAVATAETHPAMKTPGRVVGLPMQEANEASRAWRQPTHISDTRPSAKDSWSNLRGVLLR